MEWISVKSGWPEVRQEVLFYSNHIVRHGYYVGELLIDGWFHDHLQNKIPSVTHWMPLPDKPQELNK